VPFFHEDLSRDERQFLSLFRRGAIVKTLTAIYKGNRIVELTESLDLPENSVVFVVISDQNDEAEMRQQLQSAAQATFTKHWDNEEDEVWNQYV
jgi:hypothetical protein